jgi:hypothetical protein
MITDISALMILRLKWASVIERSDVRLAKTNTKLSLLIEAGIL